MKNAVIITLNKYPEGDAGAVRQHSFAKLFQDIGYNVFVIGYGEYTGNKQQLFDGIEYTSLRGKSENRFFRLLNRLLTGRSIMNKVRSLNSSIDVIMVVDVLPWTFKKIEKYAQKHNSILLHDSVEWYSPEEFPNGSKNIEYRLKEYTNTKIIHNPWKVVSISQYLNKYFNLQGIKSVRIPVIMDIWKIPYSTRVNHNKTVFVYAGGPGRKDYLKEVIGGFAALTKDELSQMIFQVVGVNKQQLIAGCGVLKSDIELMGESLVILGRVSREEARTYVMNADFSVLLRDETLRYAKAGFPTKFVESLASGTPVICNLSSDLNEYMNDCENGFIVPGHTEEDFTKAVRRAINCTIKEKENMRFKARQTAEENFHFGLYEDLLKELLKSK